jgi:hypothetical protein
MGTELGSGLIKIHVKNASNLNPDPLYAWVNFNHPELVERLRAIDFVGGDYLVNNEESKEKEDGETKKTKVVEGEVVSKISNSLTEPLLSETTKE